MQELSSPKKVHNTTRNQGKPSHPCCSADWLLPADNVGTQSLCSCCGVCMLAQKCCTWAQPGEPCFPAGHFLEPALNLIAGVVLQAVVVKPSWLVPHSAAAWWELQTAVESCWFNEEKCWNGFLRCMRSCRVEVGLSLQARWWPRGSLAPGPHHAEELSPRDRRLLLKPGTKAGQLASPSAWEVFSVEGMCGITLFCLREQYLSVAGWGASLLSV